MARLARAEVFQPTEVATVHLCARVVRRCFLFGDDPVTKKNFDHRKIWIEEQIKLQAAQMGIDIIALAVMSNHFHQEEKKGHTIFVFCDLTKGAWEILILGSELVANSPYSGV
jgi:hypothetical protein